MIDQPFRGDDFYDVGAQIGRTFKLDNGKRIQVRLDVANLFNFQTPIPQLADTDDFGVFGNPGEMRIIRWAIQRPRTYSLTVDVKF